jgi:hypothetical protein
VAPSHPSRFGPTPAELLLQYSMGYMVSSSIGVVARLKIADLLDAGPKSVADLARETQVNEDALFRVLRALASVGVFVETAPRTFANTPMSEGLRAGAPDSMRDMVVWLTTPVHFQTYAELMHSVKTGATAIDKVTGHECFEYFRHNPDVGEVFNQAMTGFSAMMAPAVLEAYDFSGIGTLADIAGGHGFLLTSILKKHSDVQGILFDLPHVCSGAEAAVEAQGLASRCRILEGDFFKSVPAADSYIMKHIIHDWDEPRAVQILKNCASAMRGKGKVLLVESVIAPGNDPHLAKWVDIEMMTMPSGKERTEKEFADLFAQAGLRFSRLVYTKSPVCVIEALKP